MNSFALSTEDALLLLEYERCDSIAEVSEIFKRDPSVISRNLKRLSEKLPVIEKAQGKWVLTELGRKFNTWTLEAVSTQQSILDQKIEIKIASTREFAHRYLIEAVTTLFPKDKYHIHLITFDSDSEKLLLNGQVDMVFDCGKPYDPQIAFKRSTSEEMSIVISKEFKSRHGVKSSKDLSELDHIHYSRNNLAKIYQMTRDKLKIGLTVNDIALVRQACINAQGWAMIPTYTIKKELITGELIEVKLDRNWKLASYKFGVWWNRDKSYLAPHIDKAVEWLAKQDLN
ncbi:hypothetical protein A9Q84_18695 [Halobacteriovorax marinus]|mgnify:CR=1 FL=1|uniref:LysR substrate-binding domain-containing protein n=1 Tax=Halobacteriovorax marinus TaxID=97084 RepID=A0A1Y5F2G0_9BACT|nr:hypothetical protein A9Q84_18695 [Halobacteriovorax marinus]